VLNLGPTHPATHGIFQNVLTMDGEYHPERRADHRVHPPGLREDRRTPPFYQITTLTDRMNYCSAPINNMGWHMTVEKLLRIETPKRVDYMRIIAMELARIADHIVCNAVIGVDTGALTGFTFIFQDREFIYEIFEEICGARLTTNMGRIGGFERNFNDIAWRKDQALPGLLPQEAEGIREPADAQPDLHGPTASTAVRSPTAHWPMASPAPTCAPAGWTTMCG
jgi:NADH-quinone oxidoreductase subunit D